MNDTMTEDDVAMCGGKTIAQGDGSVASRWFGWAKSEPGTVALQPVSSTDGMPQIEGPMVFLWEFLRSACGGKLPPFRWQFTGCCVESGYFNAIQTLIGVELACSSQPESYARPFALYSYGRSRFEGFGDSSEGEGSFGDAMAKSGADDGIPTYGQHPAIPEGVECGPALCYSRRDELFWSGTRNHPADFASVSRKHVAGYVEPKSLDDAEALLRRGVPMTWAGTWGGQTSGVVRGSKYPVLFMPRRETWAHQQAVLGVWIHPELGRLWFVQNNWFRPGTCVVNYVRVGPYTYTDSIKTPGIAEPMHGHHPEIAGINPFPVGGYWIDDNSMAFQIRNGEVRGLRGFSGYTGKAIDFGRI